MQQSAKTANGSALIGQNMENAARTGHIWSKNAGEVARNAVSKKKKNLNWGKKNLFLFRFLSHAECFLVDSHSQFQVFFCHRLIEKR